MKAFITTLFLTLITVISFAQAPPQGINYQAVAYDFNRTATPGVDMNLTPAVNRDIRVRFTILAGNAGGNAVYREYHETTTDIGGLFNLVIGTGIWDNSPGNFSQINWGSGLHFLKVEIDPRGGTDYLEMSIQQLWSVPYALYSGRAGNGIDSIIDNGDGTLTFNFIDSTSYTTNVLTGLQGPAGINGTNGTSINNSYVQNDSLFLVLSNGQTIGVGTVVGPQGPAGINGTNGTSINNSYVQNDSLFLVLSNGQTIVVGAVIGPQGPAGVNGTNGTSINNSYVQNDSLFLVLSNGQTIGVGSVVGPQGPQGQVGPIGISVTNSYVQNDSLYVVLSNGQSLNTGYVRGPSGNGFQNGTSLNQIMYWNGTTWVTLNPGTDGQVLGICNGSLGWITMAGACNPLASLSSLNCANIATNGSLVQGTIANNVSFSVPYTGGNGGAFAIQNVPSTGVTGLNANLPSGALSIGNGNLTYNITGTPNSAGMADFTFSIGGQSCNLSLPVNLPIGTVTSLNCTSAFSTGTLVSGVIASGVNVSVFYSGGNGGTYSGQAISSSGVTGLIATLLSDTLLNGNGSLLYTISGTPTSSGFANFSLSFGGQSCNLSLLVNLPIGSIATLSCGTAINTGTLTSGIAASGVSSSVPYTGGNGGTHNGQTVTSTGITGLTATLVADTFANNGAGSLIYNITGTPSASGIASFALNIGGQTCILTRTVALPIGAIITLNCGTATNTGTLTAGTAASGVSSSVPYTGGNGGTHNGQTVTSTGVTGLTATLTAGTFINGTGTLTYTITGTPSASGTASFALNIGGQSCTLNWNVLLTNIGSIATLSCGTATNTGTLVGGVTASGVISTISYTGGNGGTHNGQVVTSTGVTGLTATLLLGTFANGAGTLTYNITGTPSGSGTASFAINIGGRTCILTIRVGFRANAGPDQCRVDGRYFGGGVVCGINGRGWLIVNLNGNTPPSGGTGTWSVISSTAQGCVTQVTNGWTFSGKPSGNYTLRYTITVNGVSTFDDMNVCFSSCRRYTITRNGGTNQQTFFYRTCSDLTSGPVTLANGQSITVCAFPGSVVTNFPSTFTITTSNQSCTN